MLGEDIDKETIQEISAKIVKLKEEIKGMELIELPKDFTKKQILDWLEHIKEAPDDKVVSLLISRVEATKERLSIESTLSLLDIGCGGRI